MLQSPLKPANEGSDGLGQLRTLLFQRESARLDAVETSVGALDKRVGNAQSLEAATAEILVEALQRAEVARHRELAQAIAPVVVAAIQNEIKNSRDMMVEALYPLTGQLVVAAVTNAIRDMMAAMNERLDALTSLDRWILRFKARMTGRPIGELALAGSGQPRLTRALFLERDSGELLASWRADGLPEEKGDLISGLLAALTGFARDALGGGGGDLRTLDFGGRDFHVRASPTHIFACEFTAPLRAAQKALFDQDCYAWLDQFNQNGIANDAVFGDFIMAALMRRSPAKPRRLGWPMRVVIGLLALAALAFAVRTGLRGWREHQLHAALESTIETRTGLAAYPLSILIDHPKASVELRGLAPTTSDVEAAMAALRAAAGNYSLASRVAVIATEASLAAEMDPQKAAISSLAPRLALLEANIDALGTSSASASALADMQDSQARSSQAQKAEIAALQKQLAEATGRIAAAEARANTPRARLADLINGFFIPFDADAPILTPEADQLLDAIAALLQQSSESLRVVGYADDLGSLQKNKRVSSQRADSVIELLVARGVSRDRLVSVGRAATNPIAPSAPSVRKRNRRVAFELAGAGEIKP